MDPDSITIGLAALAGLASFLSPCVLALVPAYVGYLSGWSVSPSGEVMESRWMTFRHGVAFVFGFSLVFIAMGMAASAIGALLFDSRQWIARIGGVAIILFGLHTMGVIRIPFLDFDSRRQYRPNPSLGLLSSVLMGIFFSAGWSPCIGPVLGAVLGIAASSASVARGALLLSAYSVGMAIPFLLAALGIGRITELLRRHTKAIRVLSIITGVILVIIGVMLLTGTLHLLAGFDPLIDLEL
jgi:cytochrome c-type biogenesis protein